MKYWIKITNIQGSCIKKPMLSSGNRAIHVSLMSSSSGAGGT